MRTDLHACTAQALPAWPHVLSTGTRPAQVNGVSPAAGGLASAGSREAPGGAAVGGVPSSGGHGLAPKGSGGGGGGRLARLNPAAARKQRSAADAAHALLSEHVQALWSSYKPATRPDRGLLDRCIDQFQASTFCPHGSALL
jgi:hypothetical protein